MVETIYASAECNLNQFATSLPSLQVLPDLKNWTRVYPRRPRPCQAFCNHPHKYLRTYFIGPRIFVIPPAGSFTSDEHQRASVPCTSDAARACSSRARKRRQNAACLTFLQERPLRTPEGPLLDAHQILIDFFCIAK